MSNEHCPFHNTLITTYDYSARPEIDSLLTFSFILLIFPSILHNQCFIIAKRNQSEDGSVSKSRLFLALALFGLQCEIKLNYCYRILKWKIEPHFVSCNCEWLVAKKKRNMATMIRDLRKMSTKSFIVLSATTFLKNQGCVEITNTSFVLTASVNI